MGTEEVNAALAALEQGWDHAARTDAFFNILTIHGLTKEQFWQTGRDEIDALVDSLGPIRRVRALDFGCGVGRITQALAAHYLQADGVDISSEMIALAELHNTEPNVAYHHNPAANLDLYDDDQFDVVYSTIVLQHMPSQLAEAYVREFVRVARPGGHIVFQIPEGADAVRRGSEWLSMYGTPRADVEGWLDGSELVEVQDSQASGSVVSHRFIARAR